MYNRKLDEKNTIQTYLQFNNTERITFMVYSYGSENMYFRDFPVNLLRNVGIRQVETSHFLLLDMDMWVNGRCEWVEWLEEDMYDEIQRIPANLMNDENNLFIIPTVFMSKYTLLKRCSGFDDCVLK